MDSLGYWYTLETWRMNFQKWWFWRKILKDNSGFIYGVILCIYVDFWECHIYHRVCNGHFFQRIDEQWMRAANLNCLRFHNSPVDGSNPKQPPGMVLKPSLMLNYQPQLVCQVSSINRSVLFGLFFINYICFGILPVDMVNIPLFTWFIHPRWLGMGFLPSTVSFSLFLSWSPEGSFGSFTTCNDWSRQLPAESSHEEGGTSTSGRFIVCWIGLENFLHGGPFLHGWNFSWLKINGELTGVISPL